MRPRAANRAGRRLAAALSVVLSGSLPFPVPGAAAASKSYFVSPAGSPQAKGSREAPLDLMTAISRRTPARPGDTLWLRGGVYRGAFVGEMQGAKDQAITVRSLPGERATIDGSLLVTGAWTTYRDFEVTNSDPDRTRERPMGVSTYGPHTRFINLVVHDTGGVGVWVQAIEAEVYGCIIYHNGWQGPGDDRGHGHGIYTQNETGTRRLLDNILFNQFGWGIHAYTEQGALDGLYFEGNVSFNNGAATRQGRRYDNIFVGGRPPARRVALISNYTYHTPGKGGSNNLGYRGPNGDVVVRGNYFAGGSPVLLLLGWESSLVRGNTLWGLGPRLEIQDVLGARVERREVDDNTYAGPKSPTLLWDGRELPFPDWRQATGLDQNSRSVSAVGHARAFVRRNAHEPGRAHIIVYNWEGRATVAAEVDGLLTPGSRYEVRNVLDYFGAPVASGTYLGGPLALPMTGTENSPEFGVFVLTSQPPPKSAPQSASPAGRPGRQRAGSRAR